MHPYIAKLQSQLKRELNVPSLVVRHFESPDMDRYKFQITVGMLPEEYKFISYMWSLTQYIFDITIELPKNMIDEKDIVEQTTSVLYCTPNKKLLDTYSGSWSGALYTRNQIIENIEAIKNGLKPDYWDRANFIETKMFYRLGSVVEHAKTDFAKCLQKFTNLYNILMDVDLVVLDEQKEQIKKQINELNIQFDKLRDKQKNIIAKKVKLMDDFEDM
jgi:hypothetical protein